jgi:hypothetical protein
LTELSAAKYPVPKTDEASAMHVREALDRLDAIRDQLARSEEYRGFRAAGVATTGVIGLLAAVAQPHLAFPGADGFVTYWVAVAAVAGVLGGAPAVYAYLAGDADARRRGRLVAGQFLPCVLAGAGATAALARGGPELVALLPGVWAVVFGLGVIATRPYLPPAVAWVGLFYVAAGVVLLAWGTARPEPSGWWVGGVFGVGHFASAVVLGWGREGHDDA